MNALAVVWDGQSFGVLIRHINSNIVMARMSDLNQFTGFIDSAGSSSGNRPGRPVEAIQEGDGGNVGRGGRRRVGKALRAAARFGG